MRSGVERRCELCVMAALRPPLWWAARDEVARHPRMPLSKLLEPSFVKFRADRPSLEGSGAPWCCHERSIGKPEGWRASSGVRLGRSSRDGRRTAYKHEGAPNDRGDAAMAREANLECQRGELTSVRQSG